MVTRQHDEPDAGRTESLDGAQAGRYGGDLKSEGPIANALLPLRLVQLGRVLDDPVHLCADAEAVAGDELDGGGRVARERSAEAGGKAGQSFGGVVLPLSACVAFA